MYNHETMTPDRLLAGAVKNYPAIGVTIAAGLPPLLRGSLLGKSTKGNPITADGAANQGAGTIGATGLGSTAKLGVYTITCIVKATATFSVIDPDGFRLADAVAGVAYTGPINFTITQGNPVFELADSFTVTVPAGANTYKVCASGAVDGSQDPAGILCEDVDPTLAPVATSMYVQGEFNEDAMTFGGLDTAATHKEALKATGIILRSPVKA